MDESEVAITFRKMKLYIAIWGIGYVGMLVVSALAPGQYNTYLIFNALAIGGLLGFFLTPAWAQLKHERNTR